MAWVFLLAGAAAQQYCYWGYGTTDIAGELGSKTSAKGAIYIPADVAQRYKDCTVTKVRVGLAAKASKVTVFVTKDLNAGYAASGSTTQAYKGTNDVTLTSAYTIDGEGFYVGYAYEGDNASMAQCNVYDANGCWADLGDGWKNYAESDHAGALVIDAYIKGTSVPVDARLVSLDGIVAQQGEAFTVSGVVKNQGYSRISSLQFAYSVDGGEEQTVSLSKLIITAGINKAFSFTVDANPYTLGLHDVKVRLLSVNGAADEVDDNNTAVTRLNVLSVKPQKRMLVEEGTGILCGYCPYGIVGLESMYENYPGQFVAIAVHSYSTDGPACPADYKTFASTYFGSYPKCRIQRAETTEPRYSNLQTYGKVIMAETPKMGVEVSSVLSADGLSVEATATTTVYSKDNNEYRLAFVLTEDDVTGYLQNNNYAHGSTPMGGFEGMDSWADIDLQHVARSTYDLWGAEGSIPSGLSENETVEYSRSLSIPTTVQRKNNLNVVVLLLNMTTGEVENAAEARLGSSSTASAIASPTYRLSAAPVVRVEDGRIVADGFRVTHVYTADGRAVANRSLSHGIYIVKGTDGKDTFVRRIVF